jgi:hypothetical protein
MALDPHHEAKEAFLAHWESVTLTRASKTFEGIAPNHDHVVRIYQPPKEGSKARPKGQARPAKKARPAIPVILA